VRDQPVRSQIHIGEVAPAQVTANEGWRQMDIRFLLTTETVGSDGVCMWRTVFPPKAEHERHAHPDAEEVL
jgi:uncharacterized RmlC-like cupin family protein